MELRQLEYFQMVCRVGNITRAAERLHVSQPSVSNAIIKLENELGITLFNRQKKQISLTNEGNIFLQRVEQILNLIKDAKAEMNDYGQLKKGLLRLGIPPMIGTFLFPPIFMNFTKLYPEIELNIIESGSMTLRQMIEEGELDLGIVIISEASELLDTRPILESEIVVCFNKDHRLSNKKQIAWEDLRDEPIIMLKDGFYSSSQIMAQFKTLNIQPDVVLSSNQLETVKSLISNGVGVSFLFREIVEHEQNIISLPLQKPMKENIGLAWRKDKYLTNASRTLIDFISNFYKV